MKIKGHAIRSTTAPSKPQAPSIGSVSDTSITITWPANTEPNISGYNIQRSTDGSTYTVIVTDWPTNSYTDTNLTSGQIYYYRIGSKNSTGEVSEFSIVVSQETTSTGQLIWSQTLPIPIDFVYGIPSTFDLDPYISGTPASISVQTGQLPPNVTIVNQTLSYDGGGSSSGHTETGVSFRLNNTVQTDWATRIATPGVVWYHDFSSVDEVNNFRWTGNAGGNDPGTDFGYPDVQWDSTVGLTGGSLKLIEPADPSNDDSGWWRPFSPFVSGTTTGNGRATNDPGNGGVITAEAWNPNNASQLSQWNKGYYGHASNQNSQFDGTDYWVQIRVKPNGQAWLQPFEDLSGKFAYFHACTGANSLQKQEIVTTAFTRSVNGGGSFWMYRGDSSVTSVPLQEDYRNDTGIDISQVKPGGTCNFGTNPSGCWSFTANEWHTLLYHVVLGTQAAGDTFIEVWGAHQGETSYTKIWEQGSIPLQYEDPAVIGQQRGHNALLLSSGYNMNRQGSITQDAVNWIGQIIFAKGNGTNGTPLIPCPQVYS